MSLNRIMPNTVSSVTSCTIHGKSFVCGLFWQPLTRPRAYMKEVREIGKREGMNLAAIRHSTIMQAGFAARQPGIAKGMISMAAALASQLGNSWLGIFKLDDGRYLLVAVNDGAIIPGCDMVGHRNEMDEKLSTLYPNFCWERIYAPAEFNYDSENLDIETLLTPARLKKACRLKKLTTLGLSTKEWVIGGMVLIAIIAGHVSYTQWQAIRERRIREARIHADLIRQQQLAKLNTQTQQQRAEAIAHPWAQMPVAEDFLKACMGAVNAMPLVFSGWELQAAHCDGKTVTTAYQRRGNATVNDFLAGARSQFAAEPAFYEDGERSAIHTKLQLISNSSDEPLEPLSAMLASFSSHFQALGIKPTLTEKPTTANQPQALPGQRIPEAQLEPVPDWKTIAFSLDTEIAPDTALASLNGTGLRLTELSVKLQDNDHAAQLKWKVRGEMYAK